MGQNIWLSRINKFKDVAIWSATAALRSVPSPTTLYQSLDHDYPKEPKYGQDQIGEYVKHTNRTAYIEPLFGYVIDEQGVWLPDSIYKHYPLPEQPWRRGTPSYGRFNAARRGRGAEVLEMDTVISLRHFWDWNFYHFYLDVLGKLQLFDMVGVPLDTPIILGAYVDQLPFPRQILNRGRLKELNWVVQGDRYIKADKIYYGRTWQPYGTRLKYLQKMMDVPSPSAPETGKRVFLTRKQTGTRHVVNMAELLPILDKYRFEIADTADLSLAETIDLFSDTRYLVAVHGAGMTNMMYRGDNPMSVLELHAADWYSPSFFNICRDYGYAHKQMTCPVGDSVRGNEANMFVDPQQFEQEIIELLQN